ncbi:MFS family permease [Variovorax boronicumulans]|uniref:MFS transporter n=1 Tax=Variovorax boronicumulans TaxID=436515 RepID=UPI0027825CF9|nr:MFS transporter [Variovorax boronicumulans]MDQ0036370.1 MFS family permease [Variovorax boronicumulans]
MHLIRNPAIRLLFLGQALYWSCSIIGITLTSVAGLRLAPWPALATLPLALLVLGNLAAVSPLSMFMQRRGRRLGLMGGAAFGVAGGLVCAVGLALGSFAVFCLGAACIGGYQASAGFYRYAALEAVELHHKGRAAALVVGGGVCAAVFAPALAVWTRNALPVPFAGAYLAIAVLALCGVLAMSRLREGTAPPPSARGWAAMRTLLARPALRAAILMTAIGHGLMVLAMNATPLAMDFCGLSATAAAQVIQWHVLGMFAPAFFAGALIDRWGSRRVAMLGAATLACSALAALSGASFSLFLASSLLLGLGWNLMLIAGTTLLAEGHAEHERGSAQALMELGNGGTAVLMSLGSGALLAGIGWTAINLVMLPLLAFALSLLWLNARPAVRRA